MPKWKPDDQQAVFIMAGSYPIGDVQVGSIDAIVRAHNDDIDALMTTLTAERMLTLDLRAEVDELRSPKEPSRQDDPQQLLLRLERLESRIMCQDGFLAQDRAEIHRLRELLAEVACSGVEMQDDRVPYVTVQIGADFWKELQGFRR